ncbi:M43 family zinc metalloprotease [Micromonospora coxensis]|nr:M43 family zinc metalloprotease [Micromonospora coxensis]
MTSPGAPPAAAEPGSGGTAGMAGMSPDGSGGAGGGGGGAGGGGAQPSPHWCATMNIHRRLLNQFPEYQRARAVIENNTRTLVTGRAGPLRTGVARLPVVVHVVWQTEDQNVSDAQIHSQIAVLNADFRATNPDVNRVPEVFRELVADVGVEFHLADVDPEGNPTTGITRTRTSRESFSPDDDGVKSAATGGADAWPASRYLNLWVCRLASGLLGYAQFPGGPPQTDGVVVTYTAFGTTGTAAAPFNLGRTATHEVGHYLNLFHIWGDDGTGCGGTDEVDDTPNQAGPNNGKPTFPKVSCDNGPHGDLFVNYMDYVDDAAMMMFTKGQAARMQACLDAARSSLVAAERTATPAAPVAATAVGRVDAFRTGLDSGLYHKWWNGSGWAPSILDYEYLGGTFLGTPRVVGLGPDRLAVLVRGTDRALYVKWWDGSGWAPSSTDFQRLGGACLGDPAVVSWDPRRLDVLVRGVDRALYHKWWDGSAWQPSSDGYVHLGGICAGEPALASWGPDRLDVFVVGADSALHHKWWDGGAWQPSPIGYENLGGICAGRPVAVSRGPDRLDVFVVGADSALYHKWWDGTAWQPSPTTYECLGGVCVGDPQVVADGRGRLDVFMVGADSALYHKWWDGTAWQPSPTAYECLGGVCVGDPQVVRSGPDRLDVLVTGADSALHHKWWDGRSWLPSATSSENLGAAPTRSVIEGLVPEWRRALGATGAMSHP